MVDSNDRERAMEARDELYRVISDDAMTPRVPVVVVANKQDQPGKTNLYLVDTNVFICMFLCLCTCINHLIAGETNIRTLRLVFDMIVT